MRRASFSKDAFSQYGEFVRDFLIGNKILGTDPLPFEKPDFEILSFKEEATSRLARIFARNLTAGDVYYLRGDVGVGKSAFCREFIRAAYEEPNMAVTSPTFTLMNVYDDLLDYPPIHHYDLYRVEKEEEMFRFDLDKSIPTAVNLIEWPEAIKPKWAPEERMEIRIYSVNSEDIKGYVDEEVYQQVKALEDSGEFDDPYDDYRPRLLRMYSVGNTWQPRLKEIADAYEEETIQQAEEQR
eukprot:jgi/Bigna1/143726/aug1.81_g18434